MIFNIISNITIVSGLIISAKLGMGRNTTIKWFGGFNVEEGLDNNGLSIFMSELKDARSIEKNYCKDYDYSRYCKYFLDENNEYEVDSFKFSNTNLVLAEKWLYDRNLSKSKEFLESYPVVCLHCEDVFIDSNNVVVLRFLWTIARCKSNDWLCLKIFRNLIDSYSLKIETTKDENETHYDKIHLDATKKFYKFLLNAKEKNLKKTTDITKDVIKSYLKESNVSEHVYDEFSKIDSESLFNCSKDVLRSLQSIDLEDINNAIFNTFELDFYNFFN